MTSFARCLLGVLLLLPIFALAQPSVDYAKEIKQHRKQYKKDFLTNERSPLDRKGVRKLLFYPPDTAYVVTARIERTPDAEPFDMPTYSGITKPYVQYAWAHFQLKDTVLSLALYQSLNLIRTPQGRDLLFLPFKDWTNGEETYGGGRYLNLSKAGITDAQLHIDFNKAYNPYCAYSDGYNCPVPPRENHLSVLVKAGERLPTP